MNQLNLFDVAKAPKPDPERVRLNRQCQAILERLQRGRATNDELSKISRKYTGRISELRQAGHNVVCLSVDRKTGLSWYELQE